MSRERAERRTRREFLRQSCLAAAGVSLAGLGGSCAASAAPAPGDDLGAVRKGRVVLRSDAGVFGAAGHDAQRVRQLVFRAVADLVGVKDPAEAFRALFRPDDVVAIKPNCLAGPGMSTSPAVVDALVAGLRAIGMGPERIWIFERTSAELARAGFELNARSEARPRCLGNDEAGFTEEISSFGAVGSLWSSVLAGRATALVNVPVLKDHDLSGVGCGMKNLYGAIHNPNRYHDNNCDPYVADVSGHPHVQDKLRLVLADALTAQYQGGPARVAEHQWRPAAILAASDPVALDRVAASLIEAERKKHGLPTLAEAGRPPRWIDTAAKNGLGEGDLSKIRLDQA